ncbi:MAG: HAD family hydrolase [Paracoccaceae bacterium]
MQAYRKDQIKGLLFDKDGTLFDFHATWAVWCADIIAHFADGDQALAENLATTLQYDLAAGAFLPHSFVITNSMDDIIATLHAALPKWDYDDLYDYICESTVKAPQSPVVPLQPLLARFQRNGLKIGVATNDNIHPAERHLQSADIDQAFDFIAGCDSGYGAKPDPGMLLAFCQAVDLAPGQVVMIGDSTHDLKAGRAAEMVTIGVLTGMAPTVELAPYADVVLPNIGEIPAWLALK